MNFIESTKTKMLRFVGNGIIAAITFVMAALYGASIFILILKVLELFSGEEQIDAIAVSIALILLFVIAPLIILILATISLFKKSVALNMVAGVFSIMSSLTVLIMWNWPAFVISTIVLIGGVLTVLAGINMNREKTLFETQVLGYQQPNVVVPPQSVMRQPIPVPRPVMVNKPTQPPVAKMQQPPMQPQQPVVSQPDNNISNDQEQ